MDKAKHELVAGWLTKARHDLASARKLAEGDEPIFDTAIYHCQQAAEKAFKGYLVYCDQPFGKIHDLSVLLKAAIPFQAKFSELLDAAIELTPYATEYHYPGAEDPEAEEFEQAFLRAQQFFEYVLSQLPLFG